MSIRRKSKYNTKKFIDENGEVFDSKREYERYLYLKEQESQGRISNLRKQVVFELIPPLKDSQGKTLQRSITYKADFVYDNSEGVQVVEDVKISPRLIPQEYRLKEKIFYYRYKFPIKRIYNPKEEI